jgi:NAD(P)H-dependent FMN reductase
MKIIGFSSGAGGLDCNTDRMVRAILEISQAETEFVKLTDLTYSGCKACVHLCAEPQVCVLEDDLLPYYQKVRDADAVVLGSPVYFGTINATMMTFIERFFGYRHVTCTVSGKPFVLVTSGGGEDFEGVGDHFRKMLSPFGVKILDTVQYQSGIPPCFSCGRHQECTIGGLYGAIGKAALTMEVKPEHFRTWEDLPVLETAIDTAGEKLREL